MSARDVHAFFASVQLSTVGLPTRERASGQVSLARAIDLVCRHLHDENYAPAPRLGWLRKQRAAFSSALAGACAPARPPARPPARSAVLSPRGGRVHQARCASSLCPT
jgi:hypothetical protein